MPGLLRLMARSRGSFGPFCLGAPQSRRVHVFLWYAEPAGPVSHDRTVVRGDFSGLLIVV